MHHPGWSEGQFNLSRLRCKLISENVKLGDLFQIIRVGPVNHRSVCSRHLVQEKCKYTSHKNWKLFRFQVELEKRFAQFNNDTIITLIYIFSDQQCINMQNKEHNQNFVNKIKVNVNVRSADLSAASLSGLPISGHKQRHATTRNAENQSAN